MNMKKALRLAAMCAVMTLTAMTAFAANRPTLTVDSPENNAIVQPTPGLGEVVAIKFHTDNFKIEGLNEMAKGAQTASKTGDDNMSKTATKSDTEPMSEKAPQAGQSATNNDRGLPQSDQSGMANMNMAADEGHLHVFVDSSKWYFVHSTSDPIVLVGLAKGQHTVRLDLVGEDHKSTGVTQTVTFSVPR
jgi:Family of unknown function (DUF6130)